MSIRHIWLINGLWADRADYSGESIAQQRPDRLLQYLPGGIPGNPFLLQPGIPGIALDGLVHRLLAVV